MANYKISVVDCTVSEAVIGLTAEELDTVKSVFNSLACSEVSVYNSIEFVIEDSVGNVIYDSLE